MTKPAAPELSEQSRDQLERGKALFAKLRNIAAQGGGDHEVLYSQRRHRELDMLLAQLFTFAVEVSDRLKVLEAKAAKRKRKKA